jgi:hypothetical protein
MVESEVVTGERVQALADVTLLPHLLALRERTIPVGVGEVIGFASHRAIDREQLARISASRTIFVYTDAVGLFQEHVWPRLTGNGYVLITHNSDCGIGPEQLPWVERAGDQLTHWFAQNLVVEHPKLSPLPTGLANSRWPHGDVRLLCQVAAQTRQLGRSELIHADFDLASHPDRSRAADAIRSLIPTGMPVPARASTFAEYLVDLARHRFCACPRGNGVDTHRFWEALYLGVVPVVERSTHTERWVREGVPMVLLDDWSELSRDRLESHPLAEPSPYPQCLYLSHHARAIDAMAPIPTPSC